MTVNALVEAICERMMISECDLMLLNVSVQEGGWIRASVKKWYKTSVTVQSYLLEVIPVVVVLNCYHSQNSRKRHHIFLLQNVIDLQKRYSSTRCLHT